MVKNIATQSPYFKAFMTLILIGFYLAFHPWWPSSSDPMYKYNIDENTAMTNYYGVTGVPAMFANGTSIGSPVNADESILDAVGLSPIKILVQQTNEEDGNIASVKYHYLNLNPVDSGIYPKSGSCRKII
ncbi:MAG: hypothetical protein R2771_11305 [Saprospiraceae bacterium]